MIEVMKWRYIHTLACLLALNRFPPYPHTSQFSVTSDITRLVLQSAKLRVVVKGMRTLPYLIYLGC